MADVSPADVQHYLRGADYPCSKDDLVEFARNNGADTMVLQTIERLPRDDFDSPADISEAFGNMR